MILPLPLQPYPCVAQELQSNTITIAVITTAITFTKGKDLGAGVMFI
jgi:hypothetical protein